MVQVINSGFEFVNIERQKCECFQDYMERCYFIINNKKSGKYNLEELVEKSMIFYAISKLGCKYSNTIMEEIREMCEYAGIKY